MLKTLLFLLASGKLGKILLTGGTMLLSVFAYAWIYGLPYAIGFVLLILLHEMGHYVAARQCGLNVGAPTFIPFVGAWIALKDLPHDAETEAYIGIAGPVVGSVAALGCYFLAQSYDSRLLLALSYSGFFLNLFNLIPLSPFDGGRITAIISPRLWLLGVPILMAIFFYSPSPLLIYMALLAGPQIMRAWRYDPAAPENAFYYSVSGKKRLQYTVCYLGLAAFLAVMSHDVHELLELSRGRRQ